VCSRYRMTEEQRFGGYVVFDMSFVELGAPPFKPGPTATQNLLSQSQFLRDQVLGQIQLGAVNPSQPRRGLINIR